MTPPLVGVTPDAAGRARRQATVVAAVGAIVPTVLAAQGMASLATDLLGFHWMVAVALASFLELALVSSALLARAAALAGRPGGADVAAVWVVSGTSGLLAGMHELVATTPAGGSHWESDPGSFLAAAVRAVAPLVAAWLWERVLNAARAEQAQRTLAEVRRDNRVFKVARAAPTVRRLSEVAGGRTLSRRLRRARRRLDKLHLAALRVTHQGTTLSDVVVAVGQVDHLPAATRTHSLALSCPDTTGHPDTVSDRQTEPTGNVAVPHAQGQQATPHDRPMTGTVVTDVRSQLDAPSDTAPSCPDTMVHPDIVSDVPTDTTVVVSGHDCQTSDNQISDKPEALDVALELVRGDRSVSGSQVAAELARRGCPVSVRTGQRLRARAATHLDGESLLGQSIGPLAHEQAVDLVGV